MKPLRILALFGLCALFALATAGCREAARQELKVGVIAPLSGPGAVWGEAILRAVELAADEVNAKGGVKVGKTAYQVKVIAYDDKYTGEGGVTAANRLISQDGVKFIFGSISSASVLAFQAVTEPAKVLVLPDSYSDEVLGPTKPFSVRILMTSAELYGPVYDWLVKNRPQVKRVALVNPNDASGQAVGKMAVQAIRARGLELVANEFYERGTQNFQAVLSRLLAGKPDVIDTGATPPGDLGLILKQARELGYKGFSIGTTLQDPEVLQKIAGSAANGHIWPMQPTELPGNEALKAFVEAYNKKWPGQKINPVTIMFYSPAKLLFEIMERAGSLEPEVVRDELIKVRDYPGLYGPIKFGRKEYYGVPHQLITVTYLGELKDGKQVVVDKIDVYSMLD